MARLVVVPTSLAEANAFVSRFHRHHKPVVGHKFRIAVAEGDTTPPLLTDEQMPPLPEPFTNVRQSITVASRIKLYTADQLRERDRAVEAAARKQILGEGHERHT